MSSMSLSYMSTPGMTSIPGYMGPGAPGYNIAQLARKKGLMQEDLTAGSEQLNKDYAALYQPTLDALKEQTTSTSIVDDVRANAGSDFDAGTEAVRASLSANENMSPREKLLFERARKRERAGALVGANNAAAQAQRASNADARSKYLELSGQLNRLAYDQKRHSETLKNNYQIAKEDQKSRNKASKWNFLGTAAGLGLAAAVFM